MQESIFHINEGLPNINSEALFNVSLFTISNSTTTIILITIFFIVVAFVADRFTLIPKKFQGFCELTHDSILDFINQIIEDRNHAKVILPFVGSLMVYLAFANLLPLVPFLSSFYIDLDGEHIEIFRGATTDFNTTFGLALATVILMQIFGIKEQGFFGYMSHFIRIKQVYTGFKNGFAQGGESLVNFFVGIIEIISEIAKTLSLSLRLFGNMFAHEVLTVILLGAFSFVLPVLWMGMGVLVGLVQAVVFSALVTIYYSLVLKKDH